MDVQREIPLRGPYQPLRDGIWRRERDSTLSQLGLAADAVKETVRDLDDCSHASINVEWLRDQLGISAPAEGGNT